MSMPAGPKSNESRFVCGVSQWVGVLMFVYLPQCFCCDLYYSRDWLGKGGEKISFSWERLCNCYVSFTAFYILHTRHNLDYKLIYFGDKCSDEPVPPKTSYIVLYIIFFLTLMRVAG